METERSSEMEQEQQDPNSAQNGEASASSSASKRARGEDYDESKDVRRSGRVKKAVQRTQVETGLPPKAKRHKRGLSRIDEVRLGILHNKTCYVNYVQHPPGPNMIEVNLKDISSDGSAMSD